MTRSLLHVLLVVAFLSGGLMPASSTRCQSRTSCCGCGPSVQMNGCCCGPKAAAENAAAPVSRSELQLDRTALTAVSAITVELATPSCLIAPSRDEASGYRSVGVPLFLAHRAILI